ncbi:uncharacterized protein E0L32_001051 [Thyridium curvatum]|uniref:Uncharacterized protein n=1 Tax=Thyridium curvatum TaxID=1093900 RepID=A0A507AU13_9PEZI|nr:uncharacterized protein E0L32_001051 [Thyridium curvatum]TPX11233.1 hypothetical protein E0L32_001051 [Thyridium curvatum]
MHISIAALLTGAMLAAAAEHAHYAPIFLSPKRQLLTCAQTYGNGSVQCGSENSTMCYTPSKGDVGSFTSNPPDTPPAGLSGLSPHPRQRVIVLYPETKIRKKEADKENPPARRYRHAAPTTATAKQASTAPPSPDTAASRKKKKQGQSLSACAAQAGFALPASLLASAAAAVTNINGNGTSRSTPTVTATATVNATAAVFAVGDGPSADDEITLLTLAPSATTGSPALPTNGYFNGSTNTSVLAAPTYVQVARAGRREQRPGAAWVATAAALAAVLVSAL